MVHLRHHPLVSIYKALISNRLHALFHLVLVTTMLGRIHSPHFTEERMETQLTEGGMDLGLLRHQRRARNPAACPGHGICKQRKEEGHPCGCQRLALSLYYLSHLRKRMRYFSKLTLQGSRPFLRVSGRRLRSLGSWSAECDMAPEHQFPSGQGEAILRNKEVEKPGAGAESCSAS